MSVDASSADGTISSCSSSEIPTATLARDIRRTTARLERRLSLRVGGGEGGDSPLASIPSSILSSMGVYVYERAQKGQVKSATDVYILIQHGTGHLTAILTAILHTTTVHKRY